VADHRDVINRKKLDGIFARTRHRSSFTPGPTTRPLMELNPDEAVLNNVSAR